MPGDRRRDQPARLRAGQRRHAYVGAAVRHGLPGRRAARAGPRGRGHRRRPRRAGARARVGRLGEAGEGPADPDGEVLPASSRVASRSSWGATPSRRGTPTRASSRRWSPATPSSSSRTRGRCYRWRSRWRSRGLSCRTPASRRHWCSWPRRPTGRAWPGRWPSTPTSRSSTTPVARGSGSGSSGRARRAGALVFTEKAGVNTVVVDSTDDLRGCARQPRVLAGALLGPDVHDAAERLRARGRHRHRRGPPVVTRSSATGWPRRSAS